MPKSYRAVRECPDGLDAKMKLLELEVSEKYALLLRWNRAASANGYAGSELSDEPELVFALVRAQRACLYSLLRKAKATHA